MKKIRSIFAIKIFFLIGLTVAASFFSGIFNPSIAQAATVYDTTSSLTIPGGQVPYSLNFATGTIPNDATATLTLNVSSSPNGDNRDYFTCGGNYMFTTASLSPGPTTVNFDVSSCVQGQDLTTGNLICTANAFNGSPCVGLFYGTTSNNMVLSSAQLSITAPDTTPPTVSSFSPGNIFDVPVSQNLVMTFSEPVVVGTGNISIYRTSDNGLVEAIPVGDARVTGSGTNTITINPSVDLSDGTQYYVQIASTALKDTAGNSYVGISDTTTWSFTTEVPPPVFNSPVPTTGLATNVTQTSATLNGSVTAGTDPVMFRGFVYDTDSSYGDAQIISETSGSFSDGAYSLPLTGLTCGTSYVFAAEASDGVASVQSPSNGSFTTSACLTPAPVSSVGILSGGSTTQLFVQGVTTTVPTATATPSNNACPADELLTQDLKAGARNGKYNSYTHAVVTEANILQKQLNRLGFSAGPVDGILGIMSDSAIRRLQTFLGTKADGFIGPITRGLLNNSCGTNGLKQ